MINKTMKIVLLTAGVALATASLGRAQTAESPLYYVDFNIGGQLQSRDLSSTSTFPLYDETASVAIKQTVGRGFMTSVGGGVHFTENLAVGVSVSLFNRSTDASVVTRIPSPIVYDNFATVQSSSTGLRHTEVGTHIKLLYFLHVHDKLEIAFSAGPSFVRVSHAVPNVSEESVVLDALNRPSVTPTFPEESATAKGVNVGADVHYLLTSRYAMGAFIRYVSGSVNLPSVSGLKVGGLQAGYGVRVRF